MTERVEDARVGDQSFTRILDHASVRAAARDWDTFTSATPFRVPIPEESDVRPVRQVPIEFDPPEHGAFRRIVEPRFSRAAAQTHRRGVAEVVESAVSTALDTGTLAVVDDLALPVVSQALAATLGHPADRDRLASWGLHVFTDPETGRRRRNEDLDTYLAERVDQALTDPGDDLFGDLAQASIDGRPLTRDELLGYGYLVLAGGRDTVIASIAGALAHLAAHPHDHARLRDEPDLIPTAVEEFVRVVSPLGEIGRTVATPTTLGDTALVPGDLVSLCFASANHDPTVFDAPDECRLDRRPNRHLGFGHGPHTCLGAPLARMELAVVLEVFTRRVGSATRLDQPVSTPSAAGSTHADVPTGLRLGVRPVPL